MAQQQMSHKCSSWTWLGAASGVYACRVDGVWGRASFPIPGPFGPRRRAQVDIFGEEKLEDLSDEEQPVQREKPSTLSRFEPQMLKEYYVSQDDENIRRRDIPERLQ